MTFIFEWLMQNFQMWRDGITLLHPRVSNFVLLCVCIKKNFSRCCTSRVHRHKNEYCCMSTYYLGTLCRKYVLDDASQLLPNLVLKPTHIPLIIMVVGNALWTITLLLIEVIPASFCRVLALLDKFNVVFSFYLVG